MTGTDMHEVHAQAIENGAELWKPVEAGLAVSPVVVLSPVAANFLKVGQRHALRPVVDRLPLRPSTSAQAISQVIQLGLWHIDSERHQLFAHGTVSSGQGESRPGA